jgi:hypothetical protein
VLRIAGIACEQEATNAPIVTLRQDVRLVSIDVMVTGKDDQVVRDLKPQDFTVTESGVVQRVLHAEGHFRVDSPVSGKAGETEVAHSFVAPRKGTTGWAAEGTRLSNWPGDGEGVWNLILLDGVNASPGNQSKARSAGLAIHKNFACGSADGAGQNGEQLARADWEHGSLDAALTRGSRC